MAAVKKWQLFFLCAFDDKKINKNMVKKIIKMY